MEDPDSRKKYFINCIAVIIFTAILVSCKNDIETVNLLTARDNDKPFEISKNIELIHSENGQVQLVVKAPLLERYIGERPYLEMTQGITVIFYDSLLNETSKLTANYAINYENDRITEARNNVVVVNDKNETLNTEHLIWDEQKAIIFSNVFVKITTENEILFGEGFEADERFDKWHLKKPAGSFIINESDSL